jgi:hypothetical protein
LVVYAPQLFLSSITLFLISPPLPINKLIGNTLFTTRLNIHPSHVHSNVERLYAKQPYFTPLIPIGTIIFSLMVLGWSFCIIKLLSSVFIIYLLKALLSHLSESHIGIPIGSIIQLVNPYNIFLGVSELVENCIQISDS